METDDFIELKARYMRGNIFHVVEIFSDQIWQNVIFLSDV